MFAATCSVLNRSLLLLFSFLCTSSLWYLPWFLHFVFQKVQSNTMVNFLKHIYSQSSLNELHLASLIFCVFYTICHLLPHSSRFLPFLLNKLVMGFSHIRSLHLNFTTFHIFPILFSQFIPFLSQATFLFSVFPSTRNVWDTGC